MISVTAEMVSPLDIVTSTVTTRRTSGVRVDVRRGVAVRHRLAVVAEVPLEALRQRAGVGARDGRGERPQLADADGGGTRGGRERHGRHWRRIPPRNGDRRAGLGAGAGRHRRRPFGGQRRARFTGFVSGDAIGAQRAFRGGEGDRYGGQGPPGRAEHAGNQFNGAAARRHEAGVGAQRDGVHRRSADADLHDIGRRGRSCHRCRRVPPVVPPPVLPDVARISATPETSPAWNIVTAMPFLVWASTGSTRPRLVLKRTEVPFCTGVPLDSATNALTAVEPPAGSTRAPDVTVTVELVGAVSRIVSHAMTASWASANAAAPVSRAWLRTWFRIILTSLRRAFRRARSARNRSSRRRCRARWRHCPPRAPTSSSARCPRST